MIFRLRFELRNPEIPPQYPQGHKELNLKKPDGLSDIMPDFLQKHIFLSKLKFSSL